MTIYQALAIRISELLEEKQCTVEGLSQKSGLPQYKIEKIIKCGYKRIRLDYLIALCRGFGISMNVLLGGGVFEREKDNLTV